MRLDENDQNNQNLNEQQQNGNQNGAQNNELENQPEADLNVSDEFENVELGRLPVNDIQEVILQLAVPVRIFQNASDSIFQKIRQRHGCIHAFHATFDNPRRNNNPEIVMDDIRLAAIECSCLHSILYGFLSTFEWLKRAERFFHEENDLEEINEVISFINQLSVALGVHQERLLNDIANADANN